MDSHLHWLGLFFRFHNTFVNIFESEGAIAVKVLVSPSFFGMSGMESITGKVKNICESFALKPPKNKSFLSVALLTFWAGQFFVVESCPVHCGMLNSVPGLHPLDAGSTLSQVETTEGDSRQSRIAPLLSTILKTSSQPHYRLCIHFNIRVDQIDDQLPNTKSTSK